MGKMNTVVASSRMGDSWARLAERQEVHKPVPAQADRRSMVDLVEQQAEVGIARS